jgi:DNA-binding NarL/FixJ family response regulator
VQPDIARQFTAALTSRERDDPAHRAAVRLDWAALCERLPMRLRKILRWLAIGASKTWIAHRLAISKPRVSQLLDTLAREIKSFFGAELLPAWCVA